MDKENDPIPDWQRYERLVALLHVLECPPEYCVTANASLHGRISKRAPQIDVLIDLRHDTENSKRIIVDAKLRKRKATVQDVEAFIGLMEDVAATHGYLVCPNGFTKSAERRAQSSVTVRLLPTDQLDEIDPRT